MKFTVLVPARLASTRLPGKPLADIAGVPMVVRVARNAARSSASRIVVAADAQSVVDACRSSAVEAVLTRSDHATGSDRLAEACDLLGFDGDDLVVNVQGDEPMLDPNMIDATARLLASRADCVMATAAHPIDSEEEFSNPNVVKVVLDAAGAALYFSRAPVPWPRDARASGNSMALPTASPPLRHIGLYAYQAGFLRRFPSLAASPLETAEALEQLRVLWHGERIAVHISRSRPEPGVDTPEDLDRVRRLFR